MSADISFLVPCGIIAALSIPLMLNLVPPNDVYGFRTEQTLSKPELWFRANRFAGCALFVAAGTSGAVLVSYPQYSSGLAGLAVFVAPVLIALAASFAYVRRIENKANDEH
jgi:uncharacterized membrane protein